MNVHPRPTHLHNALKNTPSAPLVALKAAFESTENELCRTAGVDTSGTCALACMLSASSSPARAAYTCHTDIYAGCCHWWNTDSARLDETRLHRTHSDGAIHCAWVGDCRAIVVRENGRAMLLSRDHRPTSRMGFLINNRPAVIDAILRRYRTDSHADKKLLNCSATMLHVPYCGPHCCQLLSDCCPTAALLLYPDKGAMAQG